MKIQYRTKLPVRLSLRERDLIREGTFYNPHFAKQLEPDKKGLAWNWRSTTSMNLQSDLERLSVNC